MVLSSKATKAIRPYSWREGRDRRDVVSRRAVVWRWLLPGGIAGALRVVRM